MHGDIFQAFNAMKEAQEAPRGEKKVIATQVVLCIPVSVGMVMFLFLSNTIFVLSFVYFIFIFFRGTISPSGRFVKKSAGRAKNIFLLETSNFLG